MSNKTFRKSTFDDIKKILELIKLGKNVSEISRILGKDRTTIIYWRDKIGLNNIFTDNDNLTKCAIIKLVKRKPEKKVCQICKMEKDKRWEKTNHCNSKCWDLSVKSYKSKNLSIFF